MIDFSLNYGRHILDRFTKELADQDPRVIVDLGAGQGFDLQICRRNLPRAELHALESYPPNVEKLRSQDIRALPHNLEKDVFPFDSNAVDLVVANQVLEHCKELFWIFHEMSRVLKIGGHAYIGVPNLASLHSRVLLLFGRQPTCIRSASAHIRGFTRPDFVDFLESCAPGLFTVQSVQGSNFYPFPPWLARPLARLFPHAAATMFIVLRKQREYRAEFLRFPQAERLETNYWVGSSTFADGRTQGSLAMTGCAVGMELPPGITDGSSAQQLPERVPPEQTNT
jgi:SAM-dependent methyltransferase